MAGASVQSHSPPPAAIYHARGIISSHNLHSPPPPPPAPPNPPPLHNEGASSFLLSAFADGAAHLLYRSGGGDTTTSPQTPLDLPPPHYLRFQDLLVSPSTHNPPPLAGPFSDRSINMGGAKSRRAKKRQNKPPQRGLGVAQLEKIRLEEQRRASMALQQQHQQHLEASAVAAALHHRFNCKQMLQYAPESVGGSCVPPDSAAASGHQNSHLLRHSLSLVPQLPKKQSHGYDSDPSLASSASPRSMLDHIDSVRALPFARRDNIHVAAPPAANPEANLNLFPAQPYLALSSPRCRDPWPASPDENGACLPASRGPPFSADVTFVPIQGRSSVSLNNKSDGIISTTTTTTAPNNSPSSELDHQQKMMELSSFQKLRRVDADGDMRNSEAGDLYCGQVVKMGVDCGEVEEESATSEECEGFTRRRRKRWCINYGADGGRGRSSSSRSSTTASSCTEAVVLPVVEDGGQQRENSYYRMRTELTLKLPGDVELEAPPSLSLQHLHDINQPPPPPPASSSSLGFLSLCVAGSGSWSTKGTLRTVSAGTITTNTMTFFDPADHMLAVVDEEDGDDEEQQQHHHQNLCNKHQQQNHHHIASPIIIVQGLQPSPPHHHPPPPLLPSSPSSTSSSTAALDLNLKL